MISTHPFSRYNSTPRPRTQSHIQSLLTNEEVRSPSGNISYNTTMRMYNKHPLILPQRNQKLLIRISTYWGKEIIQIIQGLLVRSRVSVESDGKESKMPCDPSFERGSYKPGNEWNPDPQPSNSGPMGSKTISAVVAHFLSAIKTGSLASGIRATVFQMHNRKSLKLQCYISRGIAEISTTIKDLQDERVPPFNSPLSLCENSRDHGEWPDQNKHNEAVATNTTAIPDVLFH